MKVAIIGSGMLGLTLAHHLGSLGHSVDIFEKGPAAGGLTAPYDFGEFSWDRFYHCLMPQDVSALAFLKTLRLDSDVTWKRTRTGFFGGDRLFSVSNSLEFLLFPLLSVWSKVRLARFIRSLRAGTDSEGLLKITAADWLVQECGAETYSVFWRPLLKAKFGPFHDRVVAIILYHTIRRSFEARSSKSQGEQLGYVRGGYARIISRLTEVFSGMNVKILFNAPVTHLWPDPATGKCRVEWAGGPPRGREYNQGFFATATESGSASVFRHCPGILDRHRKVYTNARGYLHIVCPTLVLKKPLSPFYLINIGDDRVPLTGVVEMTNLVDPSSHTKGRALVYLPKYLEEASIPEWAEEKNAYGRFVTQGLRKIFPSLAPEDVVDFRVHIGRNVQPLPLIGETFTDRFEVPALESPLQILNSAMVGLSNLHVSSVVAFVDAFVAKNRNRLTQPE